MSTQSYRALCGIGMMGGLLTSGVAWILSATEIYSLLIRAGLTLFVVACVLSKLGPDE